MELKHSPKVLTSRVTSHSLYDQPWHRRYMELVRSPLNTLRPSTPQLLGNVSFRIYVIPWANLMFSPSLDTFPILVLITAGKVTNFAEFPTLSHTFGGSAWKLIPTPPFGGGRQRHLLLPGWSPARPSMAVSITGSLALLSSAQVNPGARRV